MRTTPTLIIAFVLTSQIVIVGQTSNQSIEYRFHAIDCRNGRPVRGRRVAISLSVPAKPKYYYERIEGRTDRSGMVILRFKNQASGFVRVDLADSDWGFDVRGTTQELEKYGVVKDYCVKDYGWNKKHVVEQK